MPDNRAAWIRELNLNDPRGLRLLIEEVLFREPIEVLRFMDTLNLENPYGLMTPEERRLVQGETKFVRIIIRYVRKYLEKNGRIIPNKHGRLHYVSRMNFWISLPRWVQEIQILEQSDPTPDFFALRDRLHRYAAEYERHHQQDRMVRSTHGRVDSRR